MRQNDAGLRELAGSMLDGAPIDWESAESGVDESIRRVVRELKVIAEIADVHVRVPLSSDGQATPDSDNLGSARPSEASEPGPLPQALLSWSALRLLEKVGEGAYGEVYRAWDARLDREVALKLLRPRDSSESVVIDEGRMLAQVRHLNVVTVHGADRSAGRVGLWMEFIHGRTLEQVLREQGPFGAQEATPVGLDLCRALSAVHHAGLLHRDIKAHNVMREDGGRIVLMDFGTGLERSDSAHGLAGTPLYMAPEILDGQEASVQSDLYSVGVLLYHLVTKSYPVRGRSVQDVRDAHARGERTLLRDARPDLPEPFVTIVERALASRPEARYESAGAMEAALASAMDVARPVSAATARESLDTSSVPVARTIRWLGLTWRRVLWLSGALATGGLFVLLALRFDSGGASRDGARRTEAKITRLTNLGNVRLAALSPDGQYLAYVRADGIRESLWLRRGNTTSPVQLVEPLDGTFRTLTFAPGGFVYYTLLRFDRTPVELRRVSVRGGSSEVVLDAAGGVSFSPDGSTYAYVSNTSVGLRESRVVIAAVDGGSTRVLAVRRPPESFLKAKPAWSPDGTKLALFAMSERTPHAHEILTIDLSDGREHEIAVLKVASVSGVVWPPDGRRLVVAARERRASPQRLWHVSLPSGLMRPLTNDVSDYSLAGFTHDGGTLVAVRGEVARSIWVAEMTDIGRARQVAVDSGDLIGLEGMAWSPDGRVLYASAESGNVDIWSLDPRNGSRRQLTSDPADDFHPSVSRDGRTVVFGSNRSGSSAIWVMTMDGGNLRCLTTGGDSRPALSPDGRWVAFQRGGVDTTPTTMWRTPVEGGQAIRVGMTETMRPAVSPDGRFIAHYWMTSEHWTLAITSVRAELPVRTLPISPTHAERVVRWSPDGRALAFIDGLGGASNIWLQPLDGEPSRRLTNFSEGRIATFDWSSDGSKLAWTRVSEVRDVVTVDLDGQDHW